MKNIEFKGETLKVVSTVDAVGLFCPLPVVKLKIEMEKMGPRDIVELLADDPGVQEDLLVWCRETGNRLLLITKNSEDIFVAYVERGGENEAR